MAANNASMVNPYNFQGRLQTWTELFNTDFVAKCRGLLEEYKSDDPSLIVLENIETELRKLQNGIQDYQGPHVKQAFVKLMETINDMKGALDKVDCTGNEKRRRRRAQIQTVLAEETKKLEGKINCSRPAGSCGLCENVKMISK